MAIYIGLMSGTSLDGVDGALVDFGSGVAQTLATAYIPFSPKLRAELMALQSSGANEIEREALAANILIENYASCVSTLLADSGLKSTNVCAIGAHGQTIRHRPELGFTRQINNPALLAELTDINVVADFRSRDVAAGGQGAPLVPAFHQAQFGKPRESRVVANIGGIANISVLHENGKVSGLDTGPGNILLDGWIGRHQGHAYDVDGAWAASGHVLPALLNALLDEPFFRQPAPKSTGRDLFHMEWLDQHLTAFPEARPEDVQRTLTRLTAVTLSMAIKQYGAKANMVFLCGGGAYNKTLVNELNELLDGHAIVQSTAVLGVEPNQVEAMAFAWLAFRFTHRQPSNVPAVSGAKGGRILGALYPH